MNLLLRKTLWQREHLIKSNSEHYSQKLHLGNLEGASSGLQLLQSPDADLCKVGQFLETPFLAFPLLPDVSGKLRGVCLSIRPAR